MLQNNMIGIPNYKKLNSPATIRKFYNMMRKNNSIFDKTCWIYLFEILMLISRGKELWIGIEE